MADTRVQLEVEDWVRKEWMPQHFGMNFYRERLKVRSGGVSADDNRDQTCDLGDCSGEEGLKGCEAGIEGRATLSVRGYRK
jgi:hypothetical protein